MPPRSPPCRSCRSPERLRDTSAAPRRCGESPPRAGPVRLARSAPWFWTRSCTLSMISRVDEQAEGGAEEAQIGRRVVQQAREHPAAPVEQRRARLAHPGGVALQPIQRRHHRGEDPDEQDGHFLDRMEVEPVGLVDLLSRGKPRTHRRACHQDFARKHRAAQEHRAQDDRQPGDIPQAVESPLLGCLASAGHELPAGARR